MTSAYEYILPPEAIAREPVDPPDGSRLLVVGESLEDRTFLDFPAHLQEGDVLVVNETSVVRARLHGKREPGGGAAEVMLLRPAGGGPFDPAVREWGALVRPGRKLRAGARVRFAEDGACEVIAVRPDGVRVVRFDEGVSLDEVMTRHGEMPLPPYVGPGDERRSARYQTMFARVAGSVAAPTASLHFTPRVLAAIRERGVTVVPLVLDVGYGTFKPMEGARIDEHLMHSERYTIPESTATTINRARSEGRRIVVAGTTALRALEASALGNGEVAAGDGEASLFITPGFEFKVADLLLTNFHLPRSTLLVLVSAFAGYQHVRGAYKHAIEQGYRFYSFGDAMLVHRDANVR